MIDFLKMKLIKIPKKYDAKIDVFNFFHTKFENGKQYSEKVNDIFGTILMIMLY